MEIDLQDAVIIIDEAHNIESVAREVMSFEIERAALERLVPKLLERKATSLVEMVKTVLGFTSETVAKARDLDWKLNTVLAGGRAFFDTMARTEAFVNTTGELLSVLESLLASPKDYRLVCQERKICIWCMSPALAIDSMMEHARSLILLSGTLTPFKSVADELGLEFKHTLELDHVVDVPKQVLARTVPSWEGAPMDSTYKNADTPAYKNAVGKMLLHVMRQTPNGVLLFVSSYTMMNKLVEQWKVTGLYMQMASTKTIFCESSKEADVEAYKTAASKRGALFIGVFRGKLSEGIDFADEHCRAVVVLGIPYPPMMDKRIDAKKNYQDLERKATSGADW